MKFFKKKEKKEEEKEMGYPRVIIPGRLAPPKYSDDSTVMMELKEYEKYCQSK